MTDMDNFYRQIKKRLLQDEEFLHWIFDELLKITKENIQKKRGDIN